MLPCRITARNCTGFSDNRVNLFGAVHSALFVYYNIVNWFYYVKLTVPFLFSSIVQWLLYCSVTRWGLVVLEQSVWIHIAVVKAYESNIFATRNVVLCFVHFLC
ncbi:hypothetical protein GDO78_002445 [Eleutherodactylus coqui]|uniref:Uncharacterized protein n=1 Tax=Eleutherodactylus coqui TaxID=57060 RepID=A0A8J6EXX2_ELECQ|nr:hypothetical protein GDO78_002445 [Eleutherodactylus coqui]